MKKTTTQTSLLSPNSACNRGFTLVELLVSITIIIVLAGVVVLVTGKIRAKANEASAMSTLRQVSMANVGYSAENSGNISTLHWDTENKKNVPWVRNSFWGLLQPYLFPDVTANQGAALRDELKERLGPLLNTSDPMTMAGTVAYGPHIYKDPATLPVPFVFNGYLHEYNKWVRMSSVGDPSRVIYCSYGFGLMDETAGRKYVPLSTNGSERQKGIYFMKDKTAMITFLDGHIEKLPTPIPDRLFTSVEGGESQSN